MLSVTGHPGNGWRRCWESRSEISGAEEGSGEPRGTWGAVKDGDPMR